MTRFLESVTANRDRVPDSRRTTGVPDSRGTGEGGLADLERRLRRAAFFLVILLPILFGPTPASSDPSKARLQKAIEHAIEEANLPHAFWGIEVRSLETGETLYARNATKGFRPASILKLVTTAAALDVLGPDARVRTSVETAARLDGRGRLLGDVYLVGRGDASLSARFAEGPGCGDPDDTPGCSAAAALEAMADALVAAGVRRIEGRLIGHEGAFSGDAQGLDWMREDLDWGYGAPVSALSYADNALQVTLLPGERPGDPAVLGVTPATSVLRIESAVLTGDAGAEEDITLARVPGSVPPKVLLSGTLPLRRGWDGEVAVLTPALFAASALGRILEARGVTVAAGIAASADPLPAGTRVLAVHEGAPLARLIEEVNEESQNLHAELLLRRLGLAARGEGTTEAGLEAVEEFLDRQAVPRGGWGLKDGSGLSHTNVITPRGLAVLLGTMDRHPHAEVFRASLPVAGVEGNLDRRMIGTTAEGRIRAKSGAMQRVQALAGYVTTVSGERLAFVVVVNNHVKHGASARRAIDLLSIRLSEAH
jgi:D-alanyl-D-alanine carboxypeptidase/D-alanyl-D-alanine-endopeptidase (penicillin-binding protein 4)